MEFVFFALDDVIGAQSVKEDTTGWEPPTPRPEGHAYWDEDTTSWVEVAE